MKALALALPIALATCQVPLEGGSLVPAKAERVELETGPIAGEHGWRSRRIPMPGKEANMRRRLARV